MRTRLDNLLKEALASRTLCDTLKVRDHLSEAEIAGRKLYWDGRISGLRAAIEIWGEESTALKNQLGRILS